MRFDVVREGDTLDKLSSRHGVPGCMILRANALYSPAWLLPGQEIAIPDADYCRMQRDFPCPVRALRFPASGGAGRRYVAPRGATVRTVARETGVPLHVVARVARETYGEEALEAGDVLLLPDAPEGWTRHGVAVGESVEVLAAMHGVKTETLLRVNRMRSGDMLWPGMQVWVP